MLSHYLRILFSLLIIGGFLYGIYYILTILPINKNLRNKSKRMQLVEQLFIGSGVIIYIVKIDDKEFLIGLSNKTINFIQPLGDAINFSKVLDEKKSDRNINKKTSNIAKTKGNKDGFN